MLKSKRNPQNNLKAQDSGKVLDKTVELARLLDAYGELLTERQRECLSLFYEEDFSLAEIAERFAISRQAVHDAIRHGEAQLLDYEGTLNLVEKEQTRHTLVQQLKNISGDNPRINELLDQLI